MAHPPARACSPELLNPAGVAQLELAAAADREIDGDGEAQRALRMGGDVLRRG
jgi:hypothetical protein